MRLRSALGGFGVLVLRLLSPLILSEGTLSSPGPPAQRAESAQSFLEKYGYLRQDGQRHSSAEVSSAVREFQWLSHLSITGQLDGATMQQMAAPRCGVGDGRSHRAWTQRVNNLFLGTVTIGGQHHRSKRYTQQGKKWYKRHLTYRIVNWPRHLSVGQVRLAVHTAFQLWSNVSALVFREVTQGLADIRLAFFEGEHNDGTGNAFDGPGKPSNGQQAQSPGQVFISALQDLELAQRQVEGPDSAPPQYCQGSFDAVTMDVDGAILVFRGGLFWVVSAQGNVSGPFPLRQRWPQLRLPIEAAAFSTMDNKLYVFKGRRMWRYSNKTLDPGFPSSTAELGLPRNPDCAFYYAPLGHMILFKGSRYFVLNLTILQPEPYYPRGLVDWKGLPRGANGAFSHPDGHLYVFRDQQYWQFDTGKVRVTGSGFWAQDLDWIGCSRAQGSNDVL